MFLLALIATSLAGQAFVIVAGFNRLNAQGWNRKLIKLCEKIHIIVGATSPLLLFLCEWMQNSQLSQSLARLTFNDLNMATKIYLVVMSIFAIASLPLWLSIRPPFVISKDRFQIDSKQTFRSNTFTASPYSKRSTKILGKLPRNEIAWTEANYKSIYLDHLPNEIANLKIAHLSDIHLTGQLSHEFYHRAFDWIMKQSPDLIVVAGDIVDYEENLVDIEPIFKQLTAPNGCYFILGNHDRRLLDPEQICTRLTRLGWNDAGQSMHVFTYNGIEVEIIGNERPWFDRYSSDIRAPHPSVWRLGIAHSPDQFKWGVANHCALLLCGHTHGGQIRFPLFGPLIAPSMHGSKYASGVFYKNGTVMHVSRGMAGVHPLRWGCSPEVSILNLTTK